MQSISLISNNGAKFGLRRNHTCIISSLVTCEKGEKKMRKIKKYSIAKQQGFVKIPTPTYKALSFSSTSMAQQNNHVAPSSEIMPSIIDDFEILQEIPMEDIRNFCFIAHVDHGKSSLASRVLEIAGNLGKPSQHIALEYAKGNNSNDENVKSHDNSQLADEYKKEDTELLDTLSVERERGITVKASAASMFFKHPSAIGAKGTLLLNMVDTPGHADFGFEVTRSLSSVQGAVILFDAARGVQAQTLSVYEKAKGLNIKLIPALTKVDLPTSNPLNVAISVSDLLGFDPDHIISTSARSRYGILQIINSVCDNIPPPQKLLDDDEITLRARVVDSWFEPSRGVVCLIQVLSGIISESDRVSVINTDIYDDDAHSLKNDPPKQHFSVQEIGIVTPKRIRTTMLTRGQMGYIVVGMRDPRQAKSSSIIVLHKDYKKASNMILPRVQMIQSNSPPELSPSSSPSSSITSLSRSSSSLFASVHPTDNESFDDLSDAVERLALNDTGLEIHRTSGSRSNDGGPFLGPGLRVGFQGLLHVEVFRQRLLDEFEMDAIVTPPKVPYKIVLLPKKGNPSTGSNEYIVEDLIDWPSHGERFIVKEPITRIKILTPMEFAGSVMDLIKQKRGVDMKSKAIDDKTWLFTARIPWGEVVTDFHDELKNNTSGYASFDTSLSDPQYEVADLSKVDIMLNNEIVEPLAFVSHKDLAQLQAKNVCKKLKLVLPRKQFTTIIQAKANGKIIASERVKAFRKDVLVKSGKVVGGGDVTRKKKLLEKQKRGKKRQQDSGRVTLSQAAFNSVITRS